MQQQNHNMNNSYETNTKGSLQVTGKTKVIQQSRKSTQQNIHNQSNAITEDLKETNTNLIKTSKQHPINDKGRYNSRLNYNKTIQQPKTPNSIKQKSPTTVNFNARNKLTNLKQYKVVNIYTCSKQNMIGVARTVDYNRTNTINNHKILTTKMYKNSKV